MLAGWRALGRILLGRTGWEKTNRVAEPDQDQPAEEGRAWQEAA
jgi:hypothetical protein